MRRRLFALLGGLGLLAVFFVGSRRPAPDAPSRQARAASLLLSAEDPMRTDVEALMEESDRVTASLRANNEDDVGAALRRRLSAVDASEADVRAMFENNPQVFGARSFEEARPVAEDLLRIHRVRKELRINAPDNGIAYP